MWLCHVIYYYGDKKNPYLVGIGRAQIHIAMMPPSRARDVNVENKEPFLRIPLADKQPQSNIKGGSAAAIELPSICI